MKTKNLLDPLACEENQANLTDGIDYFPLNVVLDQKVALLEAYFGLKGFAVLLKLYQWIYAQGYYCEWNDEFAALFAKRVEISVEKLLRMVEYMVEKQLFDPTLFRTYAILTSHGIQKRYFRITSRRTKLTIRKEYLLIPLEELPGHARENTLSADNSADSACNSEQSKVKKRKGKKSTEKKREETAAADAAAPFPVLDEGA